MLLGAALAHSKNTVSVKLVDALGVDAVAAFARRLGISSDLPRNLTLALGTGEVTPLELVNAYATHRRVGLRRPSRCSCCACATGTARCSRSTGR